MSKSKPISAQEDISAAVRSDMIAPSVEFMEQQETAAKQTRTRRYSASIYLDNSDPNAFYFIVAAGSVVWSVFEFNPATCSAVDKSANRMLMAAARGLLKDKATLIKLATYRLETPDVTATCLFNADNFGAVFASLSLAFIGLMPKPASANTTVNS